MMFSRLDVLKEFSIYNGYIGTQISLHGKENLCLSLQCGSVFLSICPTFSYSPVDLTCSPHSNYHVKMEIFVFSSAKKISICAKKERKRIDSSRTLGG